MNATLRTSQCQFCGRKYAHADEADRCPCPIDKGREAEWLLCATKDNLTHVLPFTTFGAALGAHRKFKRVGYTSDICWLTRPGDLSSVTWDW